MSVAVVTGANRGIGLELCRELKEKTYQVYAVCRTPSKELEELGVECIVNDIDVTDEASLSGLTQKLVGTKVDLLINNAGVLEVERWPEIDFDKIKKQFEINSLGPLKVTQALKENLGEGSFVVMITSRMGSISDNDSGGYYGYRMSKAALNAGSKSLAIDLKPQGVGVFLIHPGYVQTRMTGQQGDLTPAQSASNILRTVSKLKVEQTGTFWHSNGEQLSW